MSSRQRSYEADLVNRLSDNQQLSLAQQRMNILSQKDRDIISQQLSYRTRERLKSSY